MRSLKVAVACPYCPEGHIVTAESIFISDDLENCCSQARARRGRAIQTVRPSHLLRLSASVKSPHAARGHSHFSEE